MKKKYFLIIFSNNFFHLNDKFIRNRSNDLNTILTFNNVSSQWLSRNSLQRSPDTSFLVSLSCFFVLVNSVDERQSRFRVLDMVDSQVDSLGDDDTDGVGRDVVDSTGFTVVDLVWHTSLDGTVTFDVDDVTSFVDVHVSGQGGVTLLSEGFGEHVPGTSSFTVGVSHFLAFLGLQEFINKSVSST